MQIILGLALLALAAAMPVEDNSLVEGEYGDLIEGDMYIPKETRNGLSTRTWPNRRIYYKFDSSVDSATKNTIQQAISEYHSKTCLRWSLASSSTAAYVHFKRPASGCNSVVGRSGRSQTLNLGRGCTRKGTIVHEMMHAAGFYHEHSRTDRDRYVTIHWDNIQSNYKSAFNVRSGTKTFNLAYDYGSVMHYNARAFSSNGKNTITKKNGSTSGFGQRVGMSALDAKKINAMYGCSG